MPVPRPFASEYPGSMFKINPQAPSRQAQTLQGQGLGIWILTRASGDLILVQSCV